MVAANAPALDGATAWLNSDPLTPPDLHGHVVAYDFWTYTCVNWLRTLPYLRAWADRYRGHGLIVVGIHTPEFVFEHELANVRDAVGVNRIDYPVVVDNDYKIWRAFDNHYWPALYLADAVGVIRHHQFGEGGYEQAERVIQSSWTKQAAATSLAGPPTSSPSASKWQPTGITSDRRRPISASHAVRGSCPRATTFVSTVGHATARGPRVRIPSSSKTVLSRPIGCNS